MPEVETIQAGVTVVGIVRSHAKENQEPLVFNYLDVDAREVPPLPVTVQFNESTISNLYSPTESLSGSTAAFPVSCDLANLRAAMNARIAWIVLELCDWKIVRGKTIPSCTSTV